MRTRRSFCAVMWLGPSRDLLILALIREPCFILCFYTCMEFRLDNCFVQERLDISALSKSLLGCSLDLCLPHAWCQGWYSITAACIRHLCKERNRECRQQGDRAITRMSARRCAARLLRHSHILETSREPESQYSSVLAPLARVCVRLLTCLGASTVVPSCKRTMIETTLSPR
jgi:hypothetical protein